MPATSPVQSLGLLGDRLCVGAAGTFALYPLLNEAAPLALGAGLVPEELPPSRGGLGEALGAVELSLSEFLLLFTTAGVYVDSAGRKSRMQELLWPAVPTGWGEACGGPGWVGPGIRGRQGPAQIPEFGLGGQYVPSCLTHPWWLVWDLPSSSSCTGPCFHSSSFPA